MATATMSAIEQVGETAGIVWSRLADNGQMSVAKLAKSIDVPRDVVMQAVGWLAREDKVEIEETSRGRVVCLR